MSTITALLRVANVAREEAAAGGLHEEVAELLEELADRLLSASAKV